MSFGPIGVYPNNANVQNSGGLQIQNSPVRNQILSNNANSGYIPDPNQPGPGISNAQNNALSGGLQIQNSPVRDQIAANNILGNSSQFDQNIHSATEEQPFDIQGLFALLQKMGGLPGQGQQQQYGQGGQQQATSALEAGWNMGNQMDFSNIKKIGTSIAGLF